MRLKAFLIMAVILLAQGCATIQTRETMLNEVAGYELPVKPEPQTALVYVLRRPLMGYLNAYSVYLDGKEENSRMGYTRGWQYIYFYVNPGTHKVYSSSGKFDVAEVDIEAKPGDIIFIRQDVDLGLPYRPPSLVVIDPVEGKYLLKRFWEGTIYKVR